MVFGLITEGSTDQIVLETILARYLNDPDVDIRRVQPNVDATDDMKHQGTWSKVFKYCSSEMVQDDFESFDYTIIQIDTDVCEDYGVSKREGGNDLSPEQIIEKVKQKIIDSISSETYQIYKDKIIYAICHGSIECWFLPIYFTDNKRTKTQNCCDTLNQQLNKKESFTIDCDAKNAKYHSKVCSKIKRREQVLDMSNHQLSLKHFLDQLPQNQEAIAS